MRYYYRCRHCLSAITLEESLPSAECVCGGRLEYLGPVQHDRWMREELRPRCDGRCLSAKGPCCDCQCGGANHGVGIAGYVVARKPGGAAVVRPVDPETAVARAQEYRQARQEVLDALAARYGQAWERFSQRMYVHGPVYWEMVQWDRELRAACALLTHSNRIRKLRALAQQIRRA